MPPHVFAKHGKKCCTGLLHLMRRGPENEVDFNLEEELRQGIDKTQDIKSSGIWGPKPVPATKTRSDHAKVRLRKKPPSWVSDDTLKRCWDEFVVEDCMEEMSERQVQEGGVPPVYGFPVLQGEVEDMVFDKCRFVLNYKAENATVGREEKIEMLGMRTLIDTVSYFLSDRERSSFVMQSKKDVFADILRESNVTASLREKQPGGVPNATAPPRKEVCMPYVGKEDFKGWFLQ